MSAVDPFTPSGTVSRTVTGTTANVALANTGAVASLQIEIQSPASNSIAFIKFGTSSSVTAATTDYPIMPGVDKIVSVGPDITHVAAIGTTGTTLYFTTGQGA